MPIRRKRTLERRSQAQAVYGMLLWLSRKADKMGVPFVYLHLQVLRAGARAHRLSPPRPLKAPPESLLDE